jgi:hypothetical protein
MVSSGPPAAGSEIDPMREPPDIAHRPIDMHNSRVIAATFAVGITLLWAGASAPAMALSCAAHPDGSPRSIASGTDRLVTGIAFFDAYDFAVIGSVAMIETVDGAEIHAGRTTVSVDVMALLGPGEPDRRVAITSPDPGWMAGYPFEIGATYLIPVKAVGPMGEPNYSFLCDPISEVDPAFLTELGRLASNAGLPFTMIDPGMTPTSSETGAIDRPTGSDGREPVGTEADDMSPKRTSTRSTATVVAIVVATFVFGAASTMLVTVKKRRR